MDCPDCANAVPDSVPHCPHCARPAWFPNVRQVEQPTEVAAVERRHQEALLDVAGRGCGDAAGRFEAAAAKAQAVIGRSIEEAMRLATADNQGYASFWRLLHGGVRIPTSERWDRLRGLADWELFGAARDEVRFAALSTDGGWLQNYGDVALELAEPMIAHRATVFEENSALFFESQRRNGIEPPVVAGYRARWSDRGKLALAKHAKDLTEASTDAGFSRLLLHSGPTSEDDVFVEVHIYGSMTRRSLCRVLVDRDKVRDRVGGAAIVHLRERLDAIHVPVEER